MHVAVQSRVPTRNAARRGVLLSAAPHTARSRLTPAVHVRAQVHSDGLLAQLRALKVHAFGSSLEEALTTQLVTLQELLRVKSATVFLVQVTGIPAAQQLVPFVHDPSRAFDARSAPENRLAKQAWARRQPIVVSNPIKDSEARSVPEAVGLFPDPCWAKETTSLVTIPLVQNGVVLGVLQLMDRDTAEGRPTVFTHVELDVATLFAGVMALIIGRESGSSLRAVDRASKELEHWVKECAKGMSLPALLENISLALRNLVGVDRATIFLLDEQGDLIMHVASGVEGAIRCKVGEGFVGQAVAQEKVLNIADAYSSRMFNPETDSFRMFRALIPHACRPHAVCAT